MGGGACRRGMKRPIAYEARVRADVVLLSSHVRSRREREQVPCHVAGDGDAFGAGASGSAAHQHVVRAEDLVLDPFPRVGEEDQVGEPGAVVERDEHRPPAVSHGRGVRCSSDAGDEHVGAAGEVHQRAGRRDAELPEQEVEALHLMTADRQPSGLQLEVRLGAAVQVEAGDTRRAAPISRLNNLPGHHI